MKKLILSALSLALISSTISAQFDALDHDTQEPITTTVQGTIDPDAVDTSGLIAKIDIVNTTSEAVKVGAYTNGDGQVAGSQTKFCWGVICYDWDIYASAAGPDPTIPAGATETTFKAYYEYQGNNGVSSYTYCFYDRDNPTTENCLDISFDSSVVGIEEIQAKGTISQLSPNPVNGTSSFSYSLQGVNGIPQVEIYNMVGSRVKSFNVTNGQGIVYIDSNEFNNGLYFYSLTIDGNVLATKKFVVAQ